MNGQQVRANAANVVDWYRNKLAEVTHDLAFAQSALAESQQAVALLNADIEGMRGELDGLLGQIGAQRPAAPAPAPDGPQFGAWVSEHWDAIQDARIAYALENPEQPHVTEQP